VSDSLKDVARLEIENDRLHELDIIMLRKVKRLEGSKKNWFARKKRY